jgi:uncharacterized protein YndB with AHSA1/START domain
VTDVTHRISAVSRTVGSRTLEAGEARVVTVSRLYPDPMDDVWDACTNAERIPRWFLPVTGDLRLGGRYQLQGQAGGLIERCDPPSSFAATWEWGGEVTWIELHLVAEAGGTRLTLTHVADIDNERWFPGDFGPGAVGVGWDMILLGLTMHLESGSAIDQAEAQAWVASDEGVAFTTASSDAWCAAAIAAGDPPDEARSAADRTTSAYTGR